MNSVSRAPYAKGMAAREQPDIQVHALAMADCGESGWHGNTADAECHTNDSHDQNGGFHFIYFTIFPPRRFKSKIHLPRNHTVELVARIIKFQSPGNSRTRFFAKRFGRH